MMDGIVRRMRKLSCNRGEKRPDYFNQIPGTQPAKRPNQSKGSIARESHSAVLLRGRRETPTERQKELNHLVHGRDQSGTKDGSQARKIPLGPTHLQVLITSPESPLSHGSVPITGRESPVGRVELRRNAAGLSVMGMSVGM